MRLTALVPLAVLSVAVFTFAVVAVTVFSLHATVAILLPCRTGVNIMSEETKLTVSAAVPVSLAVDVAVFALATNIVSDVTVRVDSHLAVMALAVGPLHHT